MDKIRIASELIMLAKDIIGAKQIILDCKAKNNGYILTVNYFASSDPDGFVDEKTLVNARKTVDNIGKKYVKDLNEVTGIKARVMGKGNRIIKNNIYSTSTIEVIYEEKNVAIDELYELGFQCGL